MSRRVSNSDYELPQDAIPAGMTNVRRIEDDYELPQDSLPNPPPRKSLGEDQHVTSQDSYDMPQNALQKHQIRSSGIMQTKMKSSAYLDSTDYLLPANKQAPSAGGKAAAVPIQRPMLRAEMPPAEPPRPNRPNTKPGQPDIDGYEVIDEIATGMKNVSMSVPGGRAPAPIPRAGAATGAKFIIPDRADSHDYVNNPDAHDYVNDSVTVKSADAHDYVNDSVVSGIAPPVPTRKASQKQPNYIVTGIPGEPRVLYYHGPISREEADIRLSKSPSGGYLLRLSQRQREDSMFVLSCRGCVAPSLCIHEYAHFPIKGVSEGGRTVYQLPPLPYKFATLEELVNSFKNGALSSDVNLGHPVNIEQ